MDDHTYKTMQNSEYGDVAYFYRYGHRLTLNIFVQTFFKQKQQYLRAEALAWLSIAIIRVSN